jgi:hypothetical protein
MVLATGVVSFGVGLVAAWVLLRRTRAKLGPGARWTWVEWRAAEPVGGRWAPMIFVLTLAAVMVSLYGFGAPGWLRAGLLGLVAGICLPPFLYGIWLLLRSRREAAPS